MHSYLVSVYLFDNLSNRLAFVQVLKVMKATKTYSVLLNLSLVQNYYLLKATILVKTWFSKANLSITRKFVHINMLQSTRNHYW